MCIRDRFAPQGNLTYVQVIIGLALGKVLVARLLARPFYQSQNLATSYEYIGARIDAPTGTLSMALGLLLNTINSGVKLLTASLVLDVISGWGLAGCAFFWPQPPVHCTKKDKPVSVIPL